jgi:CubicO group peptidase (beta-lactamase class C family)
MKRILILLISGLLLTSLPCQSLEKVKVPKQPKYKVSQVFSNKSLRQVDELMERAVKNEAIPSAVCYVQYKGKVVYYKAFGDANKEKGRSLKRDAIFRNASQTKLITTVALMTLYEEGLFRLEDPVKKYLPEFSNPVVRVSGSYEGGDLVTRPAKGDITIRQLLSHSSGISYDPYDQDVRVVCYNYDEDTTVTTEEVVKRIAKLPLRHDPGKGYTYGFSLDVAGRLAEVISGKRLDELIKERVLKPLEMNDSYFYLPKSKAGRLVPLYQKPSKEDSVVLAVDSVQRFYPLSKSRSFFGGGAGMCGTIEDYSHLCVMIRDWGIYKKKRILSRKTIEQMCSDQLFGVAGNYLFGLGLEITNEEMAARTMKTPGSLRWGGMYGTEYLIDPKEDLIILFYTNKVSWYRDDVYGDFVRLVYMSLY